MVKRYEISRSEEYGNVVETATGDWVKYEEHEEEVKRLQDEIEFLEREIESLEDLLRET